MQISFHYYSCCQLWCLFSIYCYCCCCYSSFSSLLNIYTACEKRKAAWYLFDSSMSVTGCAKLSALFTCVYRYLTFKQIELKSPCCQVLRHFEYSLEPHQQGLFSSIRLEVMYVRKQVKSADNFAHPVRCLQFFQNWWLSTYPVCNAFDFRPTRSDICRVSGLVFLW